MSVENRFSGFRKTYLGILIVLVIVLEVVGNDVINRSLGVVTVLLFLLLGSILEVLKGGILKAVYLGLYFGDTLHGLYFEHIVLDIIKLVLFLWLKVVVEKRFQNRLFGVKMLHIFVRDFLGQILQLVRLRYILVYLVVAIHVGVIYRIHCILKYVLI